MESKGPAGLDARTLIAFALMIVVLVLFARLVPRQQPAGPAPGGASVETTQTPALPETTRAAPPSGETPMAPPAAEAGPPSGELPAVVNALPAEVREVVVTGERYRATFTTQGGALTSWQLFGYTDAQGQPVELVQEHPGALGLAIQGPAGRVDLSQTVFELQRSRSPAPGGGEPIEVLHFIAEGPAPEDGGEPLRVERTYRLNPRSYDMEMEVSVAGVSNLRRDHALAVEWARGIPNLETQKSLEHGAKGALAMMGERLVKDSFGGGRIGCGGCARGPASHAGERTYEGQLRWAAVRGKYFGAILIPEREVAATMVARSEPSQDLVGMTLQLPMEYEGPTHYRFHAFVGPLDYWILKDLDRQLDTNVTKINSFGGKFIAPISKGVLWFLYTVHRVVPNYGLVIILLSILVRVIFHPLNVRALRSQRKMQALKPELDALNAKYKDNPELRTKKMMELHKKYGVSPLGGCLPLLVQMPVIYALYNVLMNAIELRKAPFVFWIRDLAAPDAVGSLYGIPIHILPLLMAVTMLWQQKMTPTDPRQAPMMMLMPLFMVFLFYSLPSGLVLYWTVTNLLAIGQQMMMKPVVLPAAEPEQEQERGRGRKMRRRAR